MIVEIGGGNAGIEDYLVYGNKQGRLLSRDELDNRVVLSGDLELTSKILNSIEDKGQERYLHITLSFRENEISQEVLKSVTDDYKTLLFSAYSDDEYNFYAEAHLPKVKCVTDDKTGNLIERKPHIHIVIPEVNLLTGNKLLPTGYIDDKNTKNIPYLDSIQEYINHKYNLESPKDFARGGGSHSANILSRVKGDFFDEKNSQFKAKLVDEIAGGKINSLADFEQRLSDFGEVKIRNKGRENQYFAVKVGDDKKFTNLKHPIFSEQAIVSKSLPKADFDTVQKRLDEWKNRVSKEIKFVDFATQSFRQQYAKSSDSEKIKLLNERELSYGRKYRQGATVKGKGGQQGNYQPDSSRSYSGKSRASTRASIGVPSVPSSAMVHGTPEGRSGTQSILPENELDHLRNRQSRINSSLRRNDTGGARGNGRERRISGKPPISTRSFFQIDKGTPKRTYQKNIFAKDIGRRVFSTPFEAYQDKYPIPFKAGKFSDSNALSQLANEMLNEKDIQAERAKYAEIRCNIEPNSFLAHLKKVYFIEPDHHKISYAKDGSPRFNVGKRNLNASDFLTKHLNLPWAEAKAVLNFCYENQHNKNINQETLAHAQKKRNLKAFDYDIRRYEKSFRLELQNLNIDNRNAYREEKKRIYSRTTDPKILNQELAIASFRCMQRQEEINQLEKATADYLIEARQYFLQSGYSITSLEEYNAMKTLATFKDLFAQNSISAAQAEKNNETDFEKSFKKAREQAHINEKEQKPKSKTYQTDKGQELADNYQGNLRFKNTRLQETLDKNGIGISKHKDGKIEYKSLSDGKLICTDDGEKMRIHKKDLSPENVQFFLEVSIDRYGNELQINGSKEFKAMVVESAAAHNLPIILKPAELQEELMRRRQELEMEQKTEADNSIEAAQAQQEVKTPQVEQDAPQVEQGATQAQTETPHLDNNVQLEVESVLQGGNVNYEKFNLEDLRDIYKQLNEIENNSASEANREHLQNEKVELEIHAMSSYDYDLTADKSFEEIRSEFASEVSEEEAHFSALESNYEYSQEYEDQQIAEFESSLDKQQEIEQEGVQPPQAQAEAPQVEQGATQAQAEATPLDNNVQLEVESVLQGGNVNYEKFNLEDLRDIYKQLNEIENNSASEANREHLQNEKVELEIHAMSSYDYDLTADKSFEEIRSEFASEVSEEEAHFSALESNYEYSQEYENQQIAEFEKSLDKQQEIEQEGAQQDLYSEKRKADAEVKQDRATNTSYKMDFKFNKEASSVSVGKIYDVTINGKPAAQAVKENPKLEKTLGKVVSNNKDLQQKNITAQALASGSVQITNKLADEIKITKPESRIFNENGKTIEKSQSNDTAQSKSKAKSDDYSL